eukprot:4272497-Pyramimonas_sp.AAC.1
MMRDDPEAWRRKHPPPRGGLSMEAAREHAIRQAYKDTIDYSIKMKRSDNLLLEDEVGLTKSEHKHGKRKYQCAEQVSSDEIDD